MSSTFRMSLGRLFARHPFVAVGGFLFVFASLWLATSNRFGMPTTVAAAAVAGFSCWAGVLAAHGMAAMLGRLGGVASATTHATLGMLVRMAFPLSLCGIAALRGGELMSGGVVYAILILYPIALATDTVLYLNAPKYA